MVPCPAQGHGEPLDSRQIIARERGRECKSKRAILKDFAMFYKVTRLGTVIYI